MNTLHLPRESRITSTSDADGMTAFHRHLQEGMGPAAALRAAQEEVRTNDKWAAPYYWAGVQIIGDVGKWETGKAGRGRRWALWLGGAAETRAGGARF